MSAWVETGRVGWKTAAEEKILWVAGLVFAVTVVFSLPFPEVFGPLSELPQYSVLILLCLVQIAIHRGASTLDDPTERRLWNTLSLAYGCSLLGELVYSPFPYEYFPAGAGILASTFYGLYYALFVVALEQQPHQHDAPSPSRVERLLRWPAIASLFFGLFIYFGLLPTLATGDFTASYSPSLILYLLLDAYVAMGFLRLARHTTNPRWRVLYGLLGLAQAMNAAGDLEGIAFYASGTPFTAPLLWKLALVCTLVAVRSRHHAPPSTDPVTREKRLAFEPQGEILLFAIAFPLLHFGAYGLGVFNEDSRQIREFMVSAWLLIFGAIAMAQHRLLTRSRRSLEVDKTALQQEVEQRRAAQREKERLVEELEIKNAELERFIYTVSHDLKSPLFTIQGFLGLLEIDAPPGRSERFDDDLKRMHRAASNMGLLLDQLLQFARMGLTAPERRTTCMKELAAEAVELVNGRIEERGVDVVIADGIPPAEVDPRHLIRLYQNLLENAIKFMGDQAQPQIQIASRPPRATEPQTSTVYTVCDNGMGISEEDRETIFDLFHRLDRQVEGSGLGLAIVQRVVEMHGGQIWVESEGPGCGASFCFTMGPTV